MPLIEHSSYRPPWYLFNGHLQTIVPFWLDKFEGKIYTTERLELSDGDFLDLDWIKRGGDRLIIISHGLEGNSGSHYVKQAAKHFAASGWDVLAWNFRGCSRKLNRLPKTYHAGETEDLSRVVEYCLDQSAYQTIALVGYSIGGTMVIKYAGTQAMNERIKATVTFSVPLDVRNSLETIHQISRKIYLNTFLKKLRRKIERLSVAHPEAISTKGLDEMKTLWELNNRFTVPLQGFANVEELYEAGDCTQILKNITIPSLIVNAKNDPILGRRCYPVDQIRNNPFVFLEIPRHGGHTGFPLNKHSSWMEIRVEQFLEEIFNKQRRETKPSVPHSNL